MADGCLSDETIAALTAGAIGADARIAALAHIDTCGDCRRIVTEVFGLELPGASRTAHSGEPRSRDALAAGETVGRYVVRDCIGSGSMGIVYTARDPDLGRRVALKVLRSDPSASESQGARRRLLQEARAMARLSHPNVVAIYDVGIHGDEVFLAMELIEGSTLRDWMRRGRRSWRDIVGAFRRAADGLAAAHAVGLVHRDFKPDNVLVGNDGRVCVTDFGLARPAAMSASEPPAAPLAHTMESMTRTGAVVGTPAYMAPEQFSGTAADERSDVFSFCVAFYEALYGERPFAASSVGELTDAIVRGAVRPAPPRTRVPSWLRRIVIRGLRAAPSERPASMTVLCEAIDAGLSRRRRAIAAGAIGAAIAIGAALWLTTGDRAPDPAPAVAAPTGDATAARPTAVTDLPLPASTSEPAQRAYQRGLKGVRDGITPGHDFARAAALDPAMAEAHLRFAIEEFWRVPVDARLHLAQAAELRSKLTPRDQRVLAAAQAFMQNQPADGAAYARLLVQAQAEFPLDAELAFRAGAALHDAGDRARSLALFDRAIELDPAFGAAHRSKSDMLAYQGKLDDAVAAIERCTRDAPDATTCLGQRALIDGLAGNCRRLEQDAQRILAHDPSSDVGYYLLAQASQSQGRSLEAVRVQLHERAVRLPDALRARYETWHLWSLDVLTGNFESALERARDLERTTAPAADRRLHARAVLWWASASLEVGRPRDAATGARDFLLRKDAWIAEPAGDDFSLLRDLTPRLLLAERQGGLLSPDAFEIERAKWIDLWQHSVATEWQPFVWLHGHAAVVETRADAERAIAAIPVAGIPQYTPYTLGDAFAGTMYFRAGRTAEALPYLERAARSCVALEAPFEHTQVQLVLGEALASLGRRDEACAAYGVVLERWGSARPRSVTADRARALSRAIGCPAVAGGGGAAR
jgi:serine/threonine-protein kinase